MTPGPFEADTQGDGTRLPLAMPGDPGLEVEVRRVYSSALQHLGIPFVSSAGAKSATPHAARSAQISVDGLTPTWKIVFPQMGSEGEVELKGESPIHPGLDSLVGVRAATVRLVNDDGVTTTETALVEPWHWPLHAGTWPLLAAFVLPTDGVVRSVVAGALQRAGAQVAGCVVPAPASNSLEFLFEYLRDQWEISLSIPEVTWAGNGVPLQILRAPHRVLFDLARERGAGTCLDLTLLFAGCLEASSQAPLLLFRLDPDGMPLHAWVAIWVDQARRYRPLLGDVDVRRRIRKGEMVAVETTRVCRGQTTSVLEAMEEARRNIDESGRVVAVDVLALRPPYGTVRPLEQAYDPIVLAAMDIAEGLARTIGTSVLQTLHLFAGALSVEGAFVGHLLSEAKLEREQLLAACRKQLEQTPRSKGTGRTRGYDRCLADARENARSQSSSVVRESDLWWALLTGGGKSVESLLRGLPEAKGRLISSLARIAPSSRPESMTLGSGS